MVFVYFYVILSLQKKKPIGFSMGFVNNCLHKSYSSGNLNISPSEKRIALLG